MSRLLPLVIAAGLGAGAIGAQYPGQYPPGQYPPGQYPPGQYPPGQNPQSSPGIGLPSRHKNKSKQQQQPDANAPTIEADGQTVSNDGQKLLVATEDGRTLTLKLTPETSFVRSGKSISPGTVIPRTTVHIRAAEDDQAFLTATEVNLLKDAPQETETAQAQPAQRKQPVEEDMARPTILQTPDAPGRPLLHHGAPKQSEADDTTDAEPANNSQPAKSTAAPAQPAPKSDSTDFTIDDKSAKAAPVMSAASQQLLDRAREWTAKYMQGLPNYVCEQDTTRYLEESRSSGWQARDVITAKVIYEDGQEQYKEITVGGRKTNKGMMELGGATSTGEFNSLLYGVFAPYTESQFHFYRSDTIAGTSAAIFDFQVALPRSDWTITVGGQTLRPAYSGSLWIDHATGEVKRVEKQADKIPKDFPLDEVQTAVNYEQVRLGEGTYLLPVHAEVLSCQRGSPICSKNTIDFRDYHKFGSESTITFQK